MKKFIEIIAVTLFTYTIVRVWVKTIRSTSTEPFGEEEYIGI